MPDSLLNQLREAAQKAMQSKNVDEGMKHLAEAFSLFSQETQHLKEAYFRLQERFEQVQATLEKTNNSLREKVTEVKTVSSYLHNILTHMNQGILFIDAEGIITTYNKAAATILGKDEKKILYSNYWNIFDDNFFGFSVRQALNFGLSRKVNYISLSDEIGETKQIEVSATFVSDSPKEYNGLILLLKDITRLQRLQMLANLNDRMKELGEMAATVAHEIRNPLGGIRGYASLLVRDLESEPHLKEMAEQIIEGTKALERLVSNVLHFSRPLEMQLECEDLAFLVKEIVKFIKIDPSCPSHIVFDLHLPKEKFEVPVDRQLFRSAILNLLVNAFQAIEDENGKITISLIKNNDFAILSIADTGKGIPAKDLEKIFSPFFTTKEKGTGLGLSETYKIIQAHFGTIDVRSQPRVGTTFTITLPLKKS